MTTASDAYAWVNKEIEKLPDIPEISNNAEHGIDEGLDDAIRWFLDKVGLMDELEKLTGMPSQLTAAAQEWRAQAAALHKVSEGIRQATRHLPEEWEGDASDGFGRGMGQIVEAIDGTAKEMGECASILSQAAAECKFAEDAVVAIIREAIEWAAMSIAAMLVADIVTLGLASVVDALVVEGEVAVFLARVERVSVKLAKTLSDLMKAVRKFKEGEKSWKAFKEAKAAAKTLRTMSKFKNRRLDGQTLKDWQAHKMVSKGLLRGHVINPVLTATTGLTGDYQGKAKEAVEHFGKEALDEHDGKGPKSPEPYRVPKASIEDTFG
ncbi:WXG100 family type VII secretion target [Streptomyces sp. NPDC048650]|uniref:WXG100 family type VII secretion target n=1 Tax=unclassified Streptomyces TaxID=2593676 RepID=UPI00370FDD68